MAKIKVKDTEYEIESIRPVTPHVLQVVFTGALPEEWGDITTYTVGGLEAGIITGYDTVYRQTDEQTIQLSDNGSVYVPPEPVTPQEPYVPTAEELLLSAVASKKTEVSAACEQIIYNGITVALENGTAEHFALTEHDQINLFAKQAQLASGVEQLEYHADGQPCRYYSAADMTTIIEAAMFHVSYHTTYCNALNMWISGCETAEEVQEIYYGADVPEEYQSEVLKAYLLKIASMAEGEASETDTE